MRTNRWAALLLPLTFTAIAGCAPASAPEADYPARAVEFVVPFAAGGATDIAARVMAKSMSDNLGKPVNVVNKPGADQVTGVDYVRSSAPDGYMLLADGAGSSSLQSLLKNQPRAWDDRSFVTRVLVGPHAYAVGKKSAATSLDGVVAEAKKDPAGFSIAWLGGASTSDFALLQLLVDGGVDIRKLKRVPFQSSGDAMTAAAAGDVDLAVGGASSTFPLQKSGDLKVLAVTGDKPVKQLPDVATTAALGKPELDILYWVGVSGHSELPDAVADRVTGAVNAVVKEPGFQEKIDGIAMRADVLSGPEFDTFVAEEAKTFGALAQKLGDEG